MEPGPPRSPAPRTPASGLRNRTHSALCAGPEPGLQSLLEEQLGFSNKHLRPCADRAPAHARALRGGSKGRGEAHKGCAEAGSAPCTVCAEDKRLATSRVLSSARSGQIPASAWSLQCWGARRQEVSS